MNIPRLTLIGAGPGDIELITLKGIRAIKSADVILYDALANQELLEYARPEALRIYVGKRLGKYVYSQEEINLKIVTLALEYGHVVRLKGGDPFVFGRGFEEIEYAKNFNIECEVVSGVTGIPTEAGAAMADVTPDTISHSTLKALAYSISSNPLPNTNGSPPFNLTTCPYCLAK